MTTRTKHILQRSRDLLERSRVAAVQFLDSPRAQGATMPRVIEGTRESIIHQEPEGAVVDICASIALRDLNLVDSLLSLLERMEEAEADPDRLTELYKLDHLATRLRRNAENLRVLAGRDASDAVSDPASLVDVVRAAMSSIDGYSRVSIGRVLALGVVGIAADDLSRLLAELLDNGVKQSSPDTSVRVSAFLTDSGSVLLRIEDDGIGLPAERVAELNGRLSDEPRLTDDSVRHMGLGVVRRLAARHDMRVRLIRRSPHGTTATVLLPPDLLCDLPGEAWSGSQTVVRPAAPPPPNRQPARGPSPAHAAPTTTSIANTTTSTDGALPRRTRGGGGIATRAPRPDDLVDPGRTVNGLPRRVSRSIKNPDHGGDSVDVQVTGPPSPEDEQAGHERLLADLDAFTEGEQAAMAEASAAAPDESPPAPPPAPEPDTVTDTDTDTETDAEAEADVSAEASPETEADAEADAEVEIEVEIEVDTDPGTDAETDAGTDAEPDAEPDNETDGAEAAEPEFDADADSTPTPPNGLFLPVDRESGGTAS